MSFAVRIVMANAGDILIVGSYGVVGRRIAAQLAPHFPGRVVIAGRNQERARVLCRELRHGSRARFIDVNDPAAIGLALEGVGTVMTCVAQRERHLLCAAVERGLGYTDIAPGLAFWQGAEALRSDAQRSGARVLLGAGLCPGISNVMARQLSGLLGGVDRIETAILLSVGDEYGPDSLAYVLEELGRSWTVLENGEKRHARAFSEGRRVDFPAPFGSHCAYLFPWSDVVYYPKTLGAKTALGRFALDPSWLGHMLGALLRTRVRSWLERPRFAAGNRRAMEHLHQRYVGQDGFALVVTAARGERVARMSLAGRRQADATAVGAAELVRLLVTDASLEAGVWFPEQVVAPERFFAALSSQGHQTAIHELTTERPRIRDSFPVAEARS